MCAEDSFLTLDEACAAIHAGKILIFPTETFYGLGCDAMNPDAVGSIFSSKNRTLDLPLPVVVATRDDVFRVASHVSKTATHLMDTFWPGPLSLILPAKPEVPDLLTANAGRIAVRFSPHPAVLALCQATGCVLVASSANVSGEPAVSHKEELNAALLQKTAGIYMSGPEPAGEKPSTVVDIYHGPEGDVVRLLRQGVISQEALEHAGFRVQDVSEKNVC